MNYRVSFMRRSVSKCGEFAWGDSLDVMVNADSPSGAKTIAESLPELKRESDLNGDWFCERVAPIITV